MTEESGSSDTNRQISGVTIGDIEGGIQGGIIAGRDVSISILADAQRRFLSHGLFLAMLIGAIALTLIAFSLDFWDVVHLLVPLPTRALISIGGVVFAILGYTILDLDFISF